MAETIGSRVKRAREQKGWTQAELARRITTSANAINLLEQGTTYDPHASRIVALAQALEVSADYLLGLTEPTPAQRPRSRSPRSKEEAA
jgi:transcriptional regulator with XRE-family HTH domain